MPCHLTGPGLQSTQQPCWVNQGVLPAKRRLIRFKEAERLPVRGGDDIMPNTNVLISGILWRGVPFQLLRWAEGKRLRAETGSLRNLGI